MLAMIDYANGRRCGTWDGGCSWCVCVCVCVCVCRVSCLCVSLCSVLASSSLNLEKLAEFAIKAEGPSIRMRF